MQATNLIFVKGEETDLFHVDISDDERIPELPFNIPREWLREYHQILFERLIPDEKVEQLPKLSTLLNFAMEYLRPDGKDELFLNILLTIVRQKRKSPNSPFGVGGDKPPNPSWRFKLNDKMLQEHVDAEIREENYYKKTDETSALLLNQEVQH